MNLLIILLKYLQSDQVWRLGFFGEFLLVNRVDGLRLSWRYKVHPVYSIGLLNFLW